MEQQKEQMKIQMEQQKEQMKIQKEQMEQQKEQMEQQKEQMEQQNEQQKEQMKEQMRIQAKQHEEELAVQREQMGALMKMIQVQTPTGDSSASTRPHTSTVSTAAIPPFAAFDSTSELWPDYWSRFCTFLVANAVPDDRKAQVFLTNQTPAVYKQLANLAAQQNPRMNINDLTMDQIVKFMKEQFDPKLFIVRERFKFWSNMERKPGETLQELAARIRQDAATCDFPSIQDPQDEALRQRFICSVNNEAVLKALFKVKDTELDFAKAVKIAIETEDAAKVAKETVYGSKPRPVNKVKANNKGGRPKNHQQSNSTTSDSAKCYRLDVPVTIQDQQFTMELDTATTGNFVSVPVWKQLGKPKLDDVTHRYESASKHDLPVLGTFMGQTKDPVTGKQSSIPYIVTKIPDLNLLGRNAIQALGISVDNALGLKSIESQVKSEGAKESHPKTSSTTYASLQKDCHTLCDKFPDLFKEELGCLKDFELEVKFKSDAKPVFHKARPVPFALRDDLTKGYEEGIAKGVWKPVQFNDYGTPVVPIRKTNSAGALKPKLRICGDYSVGINDQLADHRHPMPLPEELMQKLGGGFGYTKIDLADAYNQIKLAPESQRRLALSTHRGVLLQQRLPFGIKSAPGYFQEIMENLTSDLPGVAVFQDDILTSGKDAKDHLSNLERLLTRLNDKGLRCRREKCLFAQPSVEYLGHTLSAEGISKGSKVEAVLKMPPPTDVSSLKSFLGSVQFYGKFIPNLATMAEPLYRLTKKASPWKWGEEEQAAFEQLKQVLSSDQVLVHFDPEKPVGLACDASNVGIGAVLFHRYPDGSERPIANVSKTLTAAERNYSQIHKEALAIIYGLRKFYQYLYGRQFILVTDHKPLTALFGPKKGTPLLAANRLARWALWLNQFDYTIEYRKTADHGNADALSRLPSGDDIDFDREESGEDTDMVCAIRVLSLQVKPFDSNILRQESGKDPVIATVMRYLREGWPLKHAEINEDVRKFQKLSDSLSICHGCLIYGTRVVIPQSLQPKILDLLHIGHFGMERMKQLARTAVYWPGIDAAIEMTSRRCDSCGEHQNKPSKPPVHPWMLPEKPWSRVHVDHAINFMGTNWLVITDAYSKYPCIHPTSSTSTRATLDLLEEDFAHFGYPHTLVSDNATTFVSEEFQSWCKERGITHLTGAPYHPATNGAAERLVQTFKQALRKSSLPPKRALQEFLMQYRRMPTSCGFSPSELLMSRQIRTRIDTLLPSPAHIAQGKQSKEASKTQVTPDPGGVAKVTRQYKAGDPVYALYYGPHHAKQPRWVPAVVKKSTDISLNEKIGVGVTTAVCVAVLVLFVDKANFVIRHYETGDDPEIKIKSLWLVGIYPVFALAALLAVYVPRAALLCDLASSIYLAVCLFHFTSLIILYSGGIPELLRKAHDTGFSLRSPPCCCCCFCCPTISSTWPNFRKLRLMVFQTSFLQPFISFISIVLWLDEQYVRGQMNPRAPYPYLAIVNGVSTLTAMYGLLIIFRNTRGFLKSQSISQKFVVLQLVLIFHNLQGFVFVTLARYDIPACRGVLSSNVRNAALQHMILVGEMFLLSLLARIFYRRPMPPDLYGPQKEDLNLNSAENGTAVKEGDGEGHRLARGDGSINVDRADQEDRAP
nr:hypothetical protein BaRGS_029826 [Batillaria attramentaria]